MSKTEDKHLSEATAASKPLISIRDLRVAFADAAASTAEPSGTEAGGSSPPASSPVLDGLSLDLEPGTLTALVGESGSGKTLLCSVLLGLTGREVNVSARTLVAPDPRCMSMVMQNATSALDPTMSIGAQITEALRLCERRHVNPDPPRNRRQRHERMLGLLELVGIDNPAARAKQYPLHFSGGMQQRAAIAIALAASPSVLFADEPTTSLDEGIRHRIMHLLVDIKNRTGTTILFITHDLSLVKAHAERVLILHEGRIIEDAPNNELFNHPQKPYTRELVHLCTTHHTREGASVHSCCGGRDEVCCLRDEEHDSDNDRAHNAKQRTQHVAQHTEEHGELAAQAIAGIKAHRHEHSHSVEPLVSITNLAKRRRLSRRRILQVFEHLNLELYADEMVGLCGPSGTGKSTLARCIVGLETPDAGTIIRNAALQEKGTMQMVFQDSSASLDPRMRVADLIGEPLRILSGHKPSQETVTALLEQVELSPAFARRYPHELSGGQRQRIALARALSTNPVLIVADEPVSSLDIKSCNALMALLAQLQQQRNMSILLISHDLPLLHRHCTRILTL